MFTTSEQIDAIAAALADAQTRIGNAVKDRSNPAFKSKYATLASVDDAARPELSKSGIAIVQSPTFNPSEQTVYVTTLLAHKSGQWFRSETCVPVTKMDAQGTGSAVTYARRYALAAMCSVAPDDDDDGNAATGRQAAVSQPVPVRDPKEDAAYRVVREYGDDAERWESLSREQKRRAYTVACERAEAADTGFKRPF